MLKITIPVVSILAEILKLWEQRILIPFHNKKDLFDHSCTTSLETKNISGNT